MLKRLTESEVLLLDSNSIVVFAGRGPSGPIHLGHYLILRLIANYPNVFFQVSDDEKMIRDGVSPEDCYDWSQIYDQTLKKQGQVIFRNTQNAGLLYTNFIKHCGSVPAKLLNRLFGYSSKTSVGLLTYSLIQAMTPVIIREMYPDKEIVVFSAGDQAPYFEKTRNLTGVDVTLLELPTLQGLRGHKKMSSSTPESCIYLKDSDSVIRSKILKSHSAGHIRGSVPTRQQLDSDFSYKLLQHMKLMGSKETQSHLDKYASGDISSLEFKKIVCDFVTDLIRAEK
jgi:tryptophanyl-tRNA synthetase